MCTKVYLTPVQRAVLKHHLDSRRRKRGGCWLGRGARRYSSSTSDVWSCIYFLYEYSVYEYFTTSTELVHIWFPSVARQEDKGTSDIKAKQRECVHEPCVPNCCCTAAVPVRCLLCDKSTAYFCTRTWHEISYAVVYHGWVPAVPNQQGQVQRN